MWTSTIQNNETWIKLLTYSVNKEKRYTWIKSSQIERIMDHESQKDMCVIHTINDKQFTAFDCTADELVEIICKPNKVE